MSTMITLTTCNLVDKILKKKKTTQTQMSFLKTTVSHAISVTLEKL